MGKRGPRPKPTALRILEGNPAKRPLPPNEPKPPAPARIPPPPARLDKVGRAAWREKAPYLYRLGLLTELDLDLFEQRCQVLSQVHALNAMRRRWMRDKGKRDDVLRLDVAVDRKETLFRQLEAEFGMSPASRSRVEAEPLTPPASQPQQPAQATGTAGKDPARFFRA